MLNYRLEAGKIPVIFCKNNTNFTDMTVVFRTGSANEDKDSYGIAHFLEHMVFKGTEKYNKKELLNLMTKYGEFNAETQYFFTQYYFNCIKQNFDKCFDALIQTAFFHTFPEEEIEPEKSVVFEEYCMYENTQDWEFVDKIMKKKFHESMHDIIGTKESVMAFNKEKMLRYKEKFYNEDNLVIVVTGNLDFNDLLSKIDAAVPVLKPATQQNVKLCKLSDSSEDFVFETDFEQSMIGMITPWAPINDYKISSFFSKCLSHLYYDYLRDDLGLCYGTHLNLFGGPNKERYALHAMSTNESKLELAKTSFIDLFEKIKKEGFNEEVIDIAYNKYLTQRARILDDSNSMNSFIVSKICETDDYKSLIPKLNLDIYKPSNEELIKFANDYLVNVECVKMISKEEE